MTSQQQVLSLKELGFSWTKITQLLGASRKTLLTERKEYQSVPKYSEIDDDFLDDIIQEIIQLDPNAG